MKHAVLSPHNLYTKSLYQEVRVEMGKMVGKVAVHFMIITAHLSGANSGLVKEGESGIDRLLKGEKIDYFFCEVRTIDGKELKENKMAAPNILRPPSSKNAVISTYLPSGNQP